MLSPFMIMPSKFAQAGIMAITLSSLVPIHKWPICPISALREKIKTRNKKQKPAVKI
jgi:hypothetical protein